MDRLWAPWRMKYIDGMSDDGSHNRCFLCAARDAADDRKVLVFMRRPLAFAVLNHFPYNNGHALIVPSAHKGRMEELSDGEMLALMTLTRDVMALYRGFFRPDGFNVGLNFGRAAGAGLPDHLHLHVVPRGPGTRTSCRSWARRRSFRSRSRTCTTAFWRRSPRRRRKAARAACEPKKGRPRHVPSIRTRPEHRQRGDEAAAGTGARLRIRRSAHHRTAAAV